MKRLLFLAALMSMLAAARADLPPAPAGWKLVWHDEFDRAGLPDPARWDYDVGGGGWGNQELQFYTKARPENARVENGRLIIEARREKWENRDYTSARLVTKGRGDWTHGRFEIRAKLPLGRGTWPAIWMLPTKWDLGNGGWPDVGEIDIMEHVGYDPGVVHASTHSRKHQWQIKTQRTAKIAVPDAGETFHTYVLEWDAEEIRVLVDDRQYFTSRKEGGDWTSWPFFRDFHLVLNLAVGGAWGGAKGVDESIWPRRLEVEFVRVYRRQPRPVDLTAHMASPHTPVLRTTPLHRGELNPPQPKSPLSRGVPDRAGCVGSAFALPSSAGGPRA